jgi:hypothetical protein
MLCKQREFCFFVKCENTLDFYVNICEASSLWILTPLYEDGPWCSLWPWLPQILISFVMWKFTIFGVFHSHVGNCQFFNEVCLALQCLLSLNLWQQWKFVKLISTHCMWSLFWLSMMIFFEDFMGWWKPTMITYVCSE